MKKWTGERLETFILTRDAIEHLHRYAIVSDYITDKVVLDIASGEGYGSNLMSKNASFVYGVDIDTETINKAKSKYNKGNLEFRTGSVEKIPLDDNSVDIVVSFETLEHHDKHVEMMLEVKRVLRENGLLIISTPDKFYYSDERNFKNMFHVKELYKKDFKELIGGYFNKLQLLTQVYSGGASIIDETNQNKMRVFSGNYLAIKNEFVDPLYLIVIASDTNFIEQRKSVFSGEKIHEMVVIDYVRSSNSYKLGHILLSPFKALKRRLK
ncbi:MULTISPECIES: class I SAM-dependent methyltransferase [Flavobacterium]|uniref:class I SAM-dependent methyltransferase n=1 Tax=Flavobacterium TaxID=237 RepID=UPI00118303A4|nr:MULTISPECIES: class I SAM-dependent methyltransferase [Flavobacterium]MCR4030938.1 class I SAM-dependent methyltransferase [Flavobacterium panacis]